MQLPLHVVLLVFFLALLLVPTGQSFDRSWKSQRIGSRVRGLRRLRHVPRGHMLLLLLLLSIMIMIALRILANLCRMCFCDAPRCLSRALRGVERWFAGWCHGRS